MTQPCHPRLLPLALYGSELLIFRIVTSIAVGENRLWEGSDHVEPWMQKISVGPASPNRGMVGQPLDLRDWVFPFLRKL